MSEEELATIYKFLDLCSENIAVSFDNVTVSNKGIVKDTAHGKRVTLLVEYNKED